MKNELIIAKHQGKPNQQASERLSKLLHELGLTELSERFSI